jgi:hypothetical protein
MLIKGDRTTLNITGIEKIIIDFEEVKTSISTGWFTKPKEKVELKWAVKLWYKTEKGTVEHFTWTCGDDRATAERIHNEIVQQAKEAELESVSVALENAIRKH